MATRKKAEVIPHPSLETPVPPQDEPVPVEPLDSKFTYNARTDTESITIRTNSERELEELIARWKFRIIPERKSKPKMNDGDKCPECGGFMTTQTGTNRSTGKVYYYLGCSNFPKCSMTAYIAEKPAQAAA